MKKEKRVMGAYLTVEASMVLPVVIGTIVFVICFLLFSYNRCLMEQGVAVMAVRASQYDERPAGEWKDELFAWQGVYVTEKAYGWTTEGTTLSVGPNKIEVRSSGKLVLGDRLWKASAKSEADRIRPTAFVRLCRRLQQTAEGST